jgi:hypothetical protein
VRQDLRKLLRDTAGIHFHLRRRLIWVFGATAVVAVLGAVAIYFLERDASGTKIHNYGDALFWTSAQLLTVSSQLPNPLSTGGRILDIFFELWAISVVAALAGSVGSFFTHKHWADRDRERPSGGQDVVNRPLPGGPPR